METIKQAKISPKGNASEFSGNFDCNAGVHIKTNVYIEASNRDWTIPRKRILLSKN